MMHKFLRAVFVSTVVFCAVVDAKGYEPGQIVPGIECESDSDYSYILRLPKNYDPDRKEKWPVLFVMSPMGGAPNHLQRYVPGADQCGWILAMSVESKNDNDGFVSHSAIMAMVEDLFDLYPVNEDRCYASGFSGGAREAYWLAQRLPDSIIGIIPCGAGGTPNNRGALAYGLCGTTCFNRWDMSVTFFQRVKDRGILRFFPGVHQWANADLITQAMLWLNGQYLNDDGEEPEVGEFSTMLMKEITGNLEKNPVLAYERCTVLSEIKDAPDAKEAAKTLLMLKKNSEVETYLNALEDIEEFADDHFNTSPMDYLNKRTTPDMIEDSEELAEKYAGTPYADLMTRLGKPTKDFK
jgi:pimeloyl-ACP methyl ester carboxylesterase